MERIFTAAGIAALLMLVTSFCVIGHDREAESWAREMETGMNSEEAAWTESMIQAVIRQDVDAGLQAERHLCGVTYDDVQLLARFMEAIARPGWAPRWKQLAGEVLINRMASTEFPGETIREVLFSPDGNGGSDFPVIRTAAWDEAALKPRTVRMAIELLQGKSVLKDRLIVYVGRTAKPTGYAWPPLVDHAGGVTYLCRTSHPELYR